MRVFKSYMTDDEFADYQEFLKPARVKTKIVPTPYGWVFAFLLFWIPFTGLATANNFLIIVFLMLAGLVIVSHRLAKANIASVEIIRRLPDEIFACAPFALHYHVKAKPGKRGPRGLKFCERAPLVSRDTWIMIPEIKPDAAGTMSGTYNLPARGDVTLAPGVLQSDFPFGLAVYSRNVAGAADVLVFPEIKPLEAEIPDRLTGMNGGREKPAAAGTVPFSFREYVNGDPYKTIDWKKSAHHARLISRVLSEEEAQEIVIRLPSHAGEQAISRAASLIVRFHRLNTPITLLGPGTVLGPGTGSAFVRRLLTTLARWGAGSGETPRGDPSAVTFDIDDEGELTHRRGAYGHARRTDGE